MTADDTRSEPPGSEDGTPETSDAEFAVSAAETAEHPAEAASATPSPASSAGGGFADPALLAGRPMGTYLHVVALILAAGADLGAFYPVISRVLRDAPQPLVFLVLVGLTATVIYLGHVTGTLLRDLKAVPRRASWWAPVLGVVALVFLGAVAFYLRLQVPSAPSRAAGGGFSAVAPGRESAPAGDDLLLGALVFLGLYMATVSVAIIGAYLTHNPLRDAYAVAARIHRRWSETVAASEAAYVLAQGQTKAQRLNRNHAAAVRDAQTRRLLALSAELKARSRIELLRAKRDPAVTDAWIDPDARPYEYPEYRARNGGRNRSEEN